MAENAELAGRTAVVTGAGRNIGRAIALQLAAAGAAVLVNARANREEAQAVVGEIEQKGGRALAHLADVADAELRREQRLEQMSFGDWREILGVILDGAFHCVKAALPQLRASGAGAIVNIGGLSAHTGASNRAHVVAAKAGLVGFTRALAHELAADHVTVNCVAPGLIGTVRAPGAPEPSHHQIHRTLTGNRGTPDDIAATVRFLCGPEARYITGQTFHVNGGAFLG